MGLFSTPEGNVIYLSRYDENEPFSSYSDHGFELEGLYWPTVEHYYEAMKFAEQEYREEIRSAESPAKANKLGHKRRQKRKDDWKKNRVLMMTRAIYTKCHTYSNITEKLLATGNETIFENSQYDYFWGCGRDRLGHNNYGKVLMNVRNRLREERIESS